MTTAAHPAGWSDLNTYTTRGLLDYLDYLRRQRTYKEASNLKIEARAYELRIAAAERMLAIHNHRATEAEDQRAGADRQPLTEQQVREVVRAAIDVTDAAYASGHLATVREKHDAIATRVAKELAGAVVGVNAEEVWDRIVTIADEAFGVGPVEPLDATLARIERGIVEQRQRLANLEAQREADLREAFVAGVRWGEGFSSAAARRYAYGCDEGEAAAEYARSKVGG